MQAMYCISCLYCIETLFSGAVAGNPIECSINIQAGKKFKYCNMKKIGI